MRTFDMRGHLTIMTLFRQRGFTMNFSRESLCVPQGRFASRPRSLWVFEKKSKAAFLGLVGR